MPDLPQHPPPDGADDETRMSAELLDAAAELMGRSGRSGRVRVRGGSMLPTLRPGAELAVEFGSREPRFGELIVFRQRGVLVVHRCLGRARRGGWRSRGDGVSDFDPAVLPERLVGRVLAAELDGRWIDLATPGARSWAAAAALHDLAWGAAAVAVRPLDRLLRRPGRDRPFGWRIGAVDRRLLGLAHRVSFSRCHRTLERPPG